MPITNLSIQRRRWNELTTIFKDSNSILEIKPVDRKTYRFFYLKASKISDKILTKLKRQNFEIHLISVQEGQIVLHLFKEPPEKSNLKDSFWERMTKLVEDWYISIKNEVDKS